MASRDTIRGEPLAHSPRPSRGILAQSYVEHVSKVVREAVKRASDAARFSPTWGDLLVAVVRLASEYHDLGKLDPENQAVLRKVSRQPLPIKHEDAGAAHFLSSQENLSRRATAGCHGHLLPSPRPAFARRAGGSEKNSAYRIPETEPGKEPLYKRTNSRLASYRQLHQRVVVGLEPLQAEPVQAEPRQMLCRIALSCLVDADHTDTARHYGNAPIEDRAGSASGRSTRFAQRLRGTVVVRKK